MPFNGHEDGLYLVRQSAIKNGFEVDHFGIVDVGNTLKYAWSNGLHPIVIHQTPPTIRVDWLCETGDWETLGRITNVTAAAGRIREAFRTPNYDLFGNNCEHFARYVAEGRWVSGQVITGVGMVAICAIGATWLLTRDSQRLS